MEKRRWSITGCVDTLIHNMDNSKTTEKVGQHGKKTNKKKTDEEMTTKTFKKKL